VDSWQKSHPGRHITQYDIGELFAKAYYRADSVENAVNGFLKTGICNCDMSVFTDADFVAAEVSERSEAPAENHAEKQPSTSGQHLQSAEQRTVRLPGPTDQSTYLPAPGDECSPLQELQHLDDTSHEPATAELLPCDGPSASGEQLVTPSTSGQSRPTEDPADMSATAAAAAAPSQPVSPVDIRPYPRKQRAVL